VVKSKNGRQVIFSYNELIMSREADPVILAYYREEILPHKDPEKYAYNKFKNNISGLRLIVPREPDTSRYLDDVQSIELAQIKLPENLLPKVQKGLQCQSASVNIIDGQDLKQAVYEGVKKQNVANIASDDYFLFAGCDGYRALFSGREIFSTDSGNAFLILDKLDGKKPIGNIMLATIDDFFVDRDVWGLSHIARIPHHLKLIP
jgi:hypothetical protein